MSATNILDLRCAPDFYTGHIRGSRNSPLKSLTPQTKDIFGDANAIHMFWTHLRAKLDNEKGLLGCKEQPLLILCYDGDPSRLATSMLRAEGYLAFSAAGGYTALWSYLEGRM